MKSNPKTLIIDVDEVRIKSTSVLKSTDSWKIRIKILLEKDVVCSELMDIYNKSFDFSTNVKSVDYYY